MLTAARHLPHGLLMAQGAQAKLMGVAATAEDAVLMLEALEAGTHGVILRTDCIAEVQPLL